MKTRIVKMLILSSALSGCCTLFGIDCDTGDGRAAWQTVLKGCASSDLNSDSILYFGPSNTLGPGSLWRHASDGTYQPQYSLTSIAGLPDSSTFLQKGNEFSCSGSSNSTSDLGLSLNFDGNALPVSAGLQNDLKSAQSVEAHATSVAWDLILQGVYADDIKKLPAASPVAGFMGSDDKFVMTRALRVTGYSATIKFSQTDAANLSAKYTGPQLGGALGGGMTANFAADGTLTISSPTPFYVAGEIRAYTSTGIAGRHAAISETPVNVGKHAFARPSS